MKLSKREPKHMGEVMSDIAERYDKLTKTNMKIKEIGRRSYTGQVITKNGKFWGYPQGDCSTQDRAWKDNVAEAIIWNTKLDNVTKVFCPSDMSLEGAEIKNITKTIIITEDD